MELVAEIDGVRFVNDSKATNVESALRSIESFDTGLVPIIGGRFKGGDLRLLAGRRCARAPGRSWRSARPAAGRRRARRRRAGARGGLARRGGGFGVRAGEAVGRRAARAGVRELRHVSRLRGTRPRVQGDRRDAEVGRVRRERRGRQRKGGPYAGPPATVSGEQSSVGLRDEGLAAGNAGCPGLRSWCLHPRPTDDC